MTERPRSGLLRRIELLAALVVEESNPDRRLRLAADLRRTLLDEYSRPVLEAPGVRGLARFAC